MKFRRKVLINTGNYENTTVEHEMTVELGVDEMLTREEIRASVDEELENYLKRKIREVRSEIGR